MNKIWNETNIGELTDEISIKNFKNVNYPVWSVTNDQGLVDPLKHFKKQVHSKSLKNYKILHPQEIAYNPSRIDVGSIVFNDKNLIGVISPIYVIIRCKKDLLPEYLLYFLKSDEGDKRINHFLLKGVRNNLKYDLLSKIEIPLPEISKQKEVIEIFSKIKIVKAKQSELNKLFSQVGKSIFVKMFGLPWENPKKFPIKKIIDITDVGTGGTPSRSKKEYYGGNIPWIKTAEAKNNIIYSSEEYISELGLKSSNTIKFPINSILVAMYGQGKNRGMTAKLGIPATTNQAFAGIFPSEKYKTDYLWFLLQLSYNKLRDLAHGGNQPNLNLGMIKNYEIPLAPLELQEKFSLMIMNLEKMNALQEKYNFEISKLIKSINQIFTTHV
jgi:type I restriction enzyme, S subunit